MVLYRFEAVEASGRVVSGEIDGVDKAAVVAQLHRLGQVPIRADRASQKTRLRQIFTADLLSFKPRSSRHLVVLTEQLATLLHAGLSLDRALDIARGVLTHPRDRECLRVVLEKLRGGSSLADAMAAQTAFFPKFYLGMVRAGEAGATLESTLRQLADYLAKSRARNDEIKSALIYPAMVLVTGIGAIGIMLGIVVPQLRPLFDQAGTTLPFAAKCVLALSSFLQNYWWVVLGGLTLAGIGLVQAFQDERVRRWWDGRLLKTAIIGDIVIKIEVAIFTRTLGTLFQNGIAPLSALVITRAAVTNRVLAEALEPLGASLKEGKGLAGPLSQIKYMPELALQLVRAGEEAAKLDEMLLKIADIFDTEAKQSIDRLMTLLVPAITIVLGIVVAGVIGSVLTAILSIYDLAT